MHTVVCQEWLESERGWGQRPDGCSLHLSESDRQAYCNAYWEQEKKNNLEGYVPDEYSREAGHPTLLDVSDDLYEKIKNNANGIRLWQHQYRELLDECKKRRQ